MKDAITKQFCIALNNFVGHWSHNTNSMVHVSLLSSNMGQLAVVQ